MYTPTNWVDDVTPLNAANLNNIEQGLTAHDLKLADIINVKSFGVKGDGVTDDTAALQSLFASITTPSVVLFPPGTYIVKLPLTVNVNYTKIIGYGAKIDASALTGAVLFDLKATILNFPYTNSTVTIEGLEILGNGMTSGGTLFNINNLDTTNKYSAAHIAFVNIAGHDSSTGIFIGNNAYCLTFNHCNFYSMDTIMKAPTGYSDNAERYSFSQCTLFNSNLVLDITNSADVYFDNCSIDYNARIFNLGSSRAFVNQCHIEYGKGNESAEYAQIEISSATVILSLVNCFIMGVSTISSKTFINTTDGGTIDITNCIMNNLPTSRIISHTGNPRINIYGLKGNEFAKNYVPADALSFLPDPSFEGANALTQLTVTQTGTSTITVDSTTPHSGTKCLKFNKPTAGDSCMIAVTLPATVMDRIFMDFWASYSITKGSNAYDQGRIKIMYCDKDGNTIQQYEDYFSGTSSYVNMCSASLQNSNAPKGTQQVKIFIDIYGAGIGTMYLDDLYINVTR